MIFFFNISSYSKNYENIIIEGNERISQETILVFSELPDDKFLNENAINLILKKLYGSGFFKDVIVKIENNNLIIKIIENPIIQTVFIEGIKRNKTRESLYEILSLKNRSSFNLADLKKDELALINFLKNEGYYFSKITSSYNELGDNKIDLFYKINLGDKAKIKKISFVGDKKFKNGTLQNIIISEEYKFWKFISGKKFLNENLVNYDMKLLNNFYKNRGYYNASIESSFANYLGNNEFEIIYNITAGKKFYFDKLSLNLPGDYKKENFIDLEILLSKLEGNMYTLNSIDKILNEIDKIVLNKQFEFLKSSVTEKVNDNLINLTFDIEISDKFYVEKINIFGNNITLEEVLRNNLLVDEGDAFNELLQTKTINNLKSLNFFSEVESQVINGSTNDQKIINITVSEKPTGEIMAGAGVGTDGGTIAFGISENNFLGRGMEFKSDLTISEEKMMGFISMNNPNFKGSERSLNTSIQSSITDRLSNFGYKSNKTGFSLASGFEYYENLFLTMGVSTYVEKLETDSLASTSMKKQEGSYFDTFYNYTFNYDKRDQRYKTTDGFISSFTQNVPIISNNYSLTNSYNYKVYNKWYSENIASFSFFAQSSNSLKDKNIKLSDRLILPSRRLRGFESGKVGPVDGLDYIGGNYATAINIMTTLPKVLPSFQNTNLTLFFDAANVWGVDYDSNLNDSGKIRSSVGVALDFNTPIGPLSFSLAEAITKDKNDITESFRFNLGTTF
jgi:outer membrane protein insertion porin family